MRNRRQKTSASTRTIAIIAAVIVHAIILAALFVNFKPKPKESIAADFAEKVDVVKANTVDASQLRKQEDAIKKRELEKKLQKKREEKRLQELRDQQQLEKDKIDELKRQQDEERKKREIVLKQKKEEEKREAEKRKKEERKKREDEALKKKLAQEQAQAEQEKFEREARWQLQQQLAAEEALQTERQAQERTTTLLNKHAALIAKRVGKFTNLRPSTPRGLKVVIKLNLTASGEVKSAAIIESSGDPIYDRTVQTAVLNATPLPIPSVSESKEAHNELRSAEIEFNSNDLL